MNDVLQAIKDKVSTYPPEVEVYLFGSRARGDARWDSDWDILVLVDKEKVTHDDFGDYAYPLDELGWDMNAAINPILFSKKKWEESRLESMFYHYVMNERIRL